MTLTKPQPLHLFFLVLEIEARSQTESDLNVFPSFQGTITHIDLGLQVTIIFIVDHLIGLFDR